MPDLFDLDHSFAQLADEVSHVPGPGPGDAIRASRRRRIAVIGGVAAAVTLLVLGTAYLVSPGRVTGLDPALPGHSDDALTARETRAAEPPTLDSAALDEVLASWLGAGSGEDFTSEDAIPCVPVEWASASTGGGNSGSSVGWTSSLASFDKPEVSRLTAMSVLSALSACTQPELTAPTSEELPSADVEVSTFTYQAEGKHGAVWLAEAPGGVAIMHAFGADAALPGSVDAGAAGVLVRALTGDRISQPSSSSSALPELFDPSGVRGALESWKPSVLDADGQLLAVPCLDPNWASAATTDAAGHDSLRFTWAVAQFEKTSQVMTKVAGIAKSFDRCNSVNMTTAVVPGTNGEVDGIPVDLTVFDTDTGGTNGHGAVWRAYKDKTVLVISVTGVSRALPDDTATQVAQALAAELNR